MKRYQYVYSLCIVLNLFGVDPAPANNSPEDIVCRNDKPIKCPITGTCCHLDEFCHSGLCADCPLKGIPKDELLIKCRNLTLKDINITSESQLTCLLMCHVYFTHKELNNYLENQTNVLVQISTDLLTTFKLENLGDRIDSLEQNYTDLRKHYANLSNRITEADAKFNVLIAVGSSILLLLLLLIIIGISLYFCRMRLRNKKASNIKLDEMQHLIDTRNEESMQRVTEANEVIESMKKDVQGMKKFMDTRLDHFNKEIDDMKLENSNLKTSLQGQEEMIAIKTESDVSISENITVTERSAVESASHNNKTQTQDKKD